MTGFLVALIGHWIGWLWVTRVAAVGLALTLVGFGVVAVWKGWDEDPPPEFWTPVRPWPPAAEMGPEPEPEPPPQPRTYRLDRTPRTYQDRGQ